MRYLVLYTVFIVLALTSRAQGDTQHVQLTTSSPSIDYWDLNKYTWSHTHPTPSKADKPVLDFNAIEKWTEIGSDLSISPNGQFFAYSIQNTQTKRQDTLVVQSTRDAWRQPLSSARPGFFTADSKLYIFEDKEGLCFLQTGKDEIRKIKDIVSFQQPFKNKGKWLACQLKNKEATLVLLDLLTGAEKQFDQVSRYSFDQKGQWLACQLNNEAKELLVYHLDNGKEIRFPAVGGYLFDANGQAMLIKTTGNSVGGSSIALQYVNLSDKAIHTFWQATDSTTSVLNYDFDGTGKQVVFVVQDKAVSTGTPPKSNYSIWYWRTGMDKATLKVNNHTVGIEAGLFIEGSAGFTDNNRYILFNLQLQAADLGKPRPNAVKVDVWSYKDTVIQSTQPYLLKTPPQTYGAVIPTESSEVIRLDKGHESLGSLQGDFTIIEKSIQKINGDRFWEKDYHKDSLWLVSLKNGSRRFIGQMPEHDRHTRLSPGGKYLVYFDASRQCHYFSIELGTGKLAHISAGIPALQLGQVDDYKRPREKPIYSAGLLGWLEADAGLLVYDQHGDIWQLDLAGKKLPINITNGYGQAHHIQFKLLGYKHDLSGVPILQAKDTLLLTAFNTTNKQHGFYRKIVNQAGNPEQLYMGPYNLNITLNANDSKAADAHVWIVKRESVTEAPNYYMTTNFKTYTPLTDLQPHKGYNWLTAELHAIKQQDGTTSQGILYKPENFDPAKKYPVIIAFYGTFSDQLYDYKHPDYIWAPIAPAWNPSWMVSHGYLVFTPDIYFTAGKWGLSALNTVEGAAKYLSSLPYVDSKRLGACGHSNSGRFGYYVLTHSNSFAAMSVGSGTTNVISLALSLNSGDENEASRLEWAEVSAYGGGLGNLWQNKTTWLDHTSVLHAGKVISPLLMFHNKKDGVPVGEAVAMFTALRRLEKKAWWLQYDEGRHVVRGKEAKDLTIRYTQFFDHYLKGAPAPHWMTQGLPYKLKGIENGYELDLEGYCGNNCPVCKTRKTSNPDK